MTTHRKIALVADAEAETRHLAYRLLEEQGYLVGACPRGLDALKFVAAHKPALVVTALGLEDMQGLALARGVRRISPATRLLLLDKRPDRLELREIRDGRVGNRLGVSLRRGDGPGSEEEAAAKVPPG